MPTIRERETLIIKNCNILKKLFIFEPSSIIVRKNYTNSFPFLNVFLLACVVFYSRIDGGKY